VDASEFIKRLYAIKKKHGGHQGVFSGRGIAIPVGGAVDGSGDGSKYLGRPRRPLSMDAAGSPSMHADSGFASIDAMARVNKGYTDIFTSKPMFPEQEVSEEDNYIIEDSLDNLKEMNVDLDKIYFDESKIVKNSSYSLKGLDFLSEDISIDDIQTGLDRLGSELNIDVPDIRSLRLPTTSEIEDYTGIDIPRNVEDVEDIIGIDIPTIEIPEEYEDAYNEMLGYARSFGGELARDVSISLFSLVPIIGPGAAAGAAYTNLLELESDEEDILEGIDQLLLLGTVAERNALMQISSDSFDDYIDFLQAVTLLIPIVGPTTGIFRIIRRLLEFIKQGRATTVLGLGGTLSAAVMSQILGSPLFKFAVDFLESDLSSITGVDRERMLGVLLRVPATLIVVGDLIDDFDRQKSEFDQMGIGDENFKFDPLQYGSETDIAAAEERQQQRDASLDIRGLIADVVEQIRSDELQESNNMKLNKLLKEFIRETVYHEIQGFNEAKPEGFEYRQPEGVEVDDEMVVPYEKNTDQLVRYKADEGQVAYQARPGDIREAALRRIIRRELLSLNEKKK
jgi:hypothetical protein